MWNMNIRKRKGGGDIFFLLVALFPPHPPPSVVIIPLIYSFLHILFWPPLIISSLPPNMQPQSSAGSFSWLDFLHSMTQATPQARDEQQHSKSPTSTLIHQIGPTPSVRNKKPPPVPVFDDTEESDPPPPPLAPKLSALSNMNRTDSGSSTVSLPADLSRTPVATISMPQSNSLASVDSSTPSPPSSLAEVHPSTKRLPPPPPFRPG